MPPTMTFFAVLVLLNSIYCDAELWDVMERQSCPSPSSCLSGSSTCSSQNCPGGQKCCIDFVRGIACCLSAVATTTPTSTSIPSCPIGVSTASFCLGIEDASICTGPQDCYPDELCCMIRSDFPFPCCISNTRPPPAVF